MNDFMYHNPTTIEFGRAKENSIGQYIKEANIESVLLVYGTGSIKKNGLYERVIASLKSNGISYEELDEVVSNPLLSRVNDGIKIVKDKNIQAVLGVGGGSVADSAKAIAAGAKYDGDVWDFFINKAQISEALPVFTVMTLAATASEMNGNSVIINDETSQKYSISSVLVNPVVSVVNPELMATVSKEYLAYSAVDIIAHSIEVYFTASLHPNFNSRIVESIIKTVIETTEVLIENPDDYDARAEFAWVAIQALNGLTPAGTEGGNFPNHMIEHSLSAIYNVAHGAGLSVVIPAWMKWYENQNPEQFKRFAKEIFSEEESSKGIEKLEEWFAKIGAPTTLEAAGIPRSGIQALAQNANALASVWGIGDIYSSDTIAEILEKA
ncbi:iron-containing NADP-dependent alcohol dehydrogenase [Sulfurimonas gotlandica GD1]|uniref:Iron-containing NADP-dependent alcohol dehydrogenase n=1 Tax=Sulfurimonas gotlandica (strain DSM 19862 / JCM 16533 / GD1) TaxID=929558 RepID=B6BK28_SULGG|nr:iron-containing alcohol dehydrogenase [Sulfurimonas gotlandica]EDZ62562.1 NADH-dependent butanol dehydrogenase a [Sulfurimonas gotlandica GD1]EHP31119.1 iron-containing NADP-dependent alcohol dehydrogenase [Sulfurimonas gotlandica GD1]